MTINQRPIVAITMGDAAGVGPEIVVKALLSKQIFDVCRPLVVGEGNTMSEIIRWLDSPVNLHHVEKAGEIKGRFGTIDLLDLHNLDQKEVIIGKVNKACGKAAMEYIATAAELVLQKKVKAIVTAPINKEATIQAGYWLITKRIIKSLKSIRHLGIGKKLLNYYNLVKHPIRLCVVMKKH